MLVTSHGRECLLLSVIGSLTGSFVKRIRSGHVTIKPWGSYPAAHPHPLPLWGAAEQGLVDTPSPRQHDGAGEQLLWQVTMATPGLCKSFHFAQHGSE